jgi:hypothetical protein
MHSDRLAIPVLALAFLCAGCPGTGPPPDAAKSVDPVEKLDSALRASLDACRRGCEAGFAEYAAGADLPLQEGLLRVTVVVTSESEVAGVQGRVEALGGVIVAQLENHLYTRLPVEAIQPLAELEEVWMLEIARATSFQSTQPSGSASEPGVGAGAEPTRPPREEVNR